MKNKYLKQIENKDFIRKAKDYRAIISKELLDLNKEALFSKFVKLTKDKKPKPHNNMRSAKLLDKIRTKYQPKKKRGDMIENVLTRFEKRQQFTKSIFELE